MEPVPHLLGIVSFAVLLIFTFFLKNQSPFVKAAGSFMVENWCKVFHSSSEKLTGLNIAGQKAASAGLRISLVWTSLGNRIP